MIKFFVDPGDIHGAYIYIEDTADIKHLIKVLRSKTGDKISISDGMQWEYETEIEEIEEDRITLRITDKQKFAREPETRITLFQGIPKGTKMETIIQKTVELGVDTIVPVFMDRTIVVEKGNFNKKLERWQKISDEAVKQCKRGIIPQIHEQIRFKQMLNMLDQFDLVICPYENEENETIKDCLRNYCLSMSTDSSRAGRVAVIIGPEGGFSQEEIDHLSCNKLKEVKIVTLGKTILRTETAGPAAIAMVMYELEL